MLHHPPSQAYSGLTIVLGRPSRLDTSSLISGIAGTHFDMFLSPISRASCDIRTANNYTDFLPDTKVVLLLGDEAHDKHNKDGGLSEYRGAPYEKDGYIFISSFAPQDALDRQNYEDRWHGSDDNDGDEDEGDEKTHGRTKRQNYRFWLRNDVKKAVDIVKDGLHVHDEEHVIWPGSKEVINKLRSVRGSRIYFDIETDSQLQMTCFGFSFEDDKQVFVVPMVQTFMKPRQYLYDDIDVAKVLGALAIALNSNEVVIHNAKFDLFILAWRFGIPIPRKVFCTMIAHHRCYPEVEKSLSHVLSKYTHQPYHKNEGVWEPYNHLQAESLYHYNAKDVTALKGVYKGLQKEIAKLKAEESVAQAMFMIPSYLLTQLVGIKYDNAKSDAKQVECAKKQLQYKRFLRLLTQRDFNPGSWQQVAKYLYADMGYKEPLKDKTNSKTLMQLLLKVNNPVITIILQYRAEGMKKGALKFTRWHGLWKNQNRIEAEATAIRERLGCEVFTARPDIATCDYKLTGTNTYRLSSAKLIPRTLGVGRNLQNIDKELRKLYIPNNGMVFVQVDQAGAEALIVAYQCRPGNFRNLFLNNIKSHVYVAMRVFQKEWETRLDYKIQEFIDAPINEITSLKNWKELDAIIKASDNWPASTRYYYIAKMICHSSNYGIKAPTFRLNVLDKSEGKIVLPLSEAQYYLTSYHGLFPEIQQWHVDTISELRRTRLLRNLFGYPRVFTGPESDELFRLSYAFVPQSTVGTITNLAWVKLQGMIDNGELNATLKQNNHDSILAECRPDDAMLVGRAIQSAMNIDLTSTRGEKYQMKSAISIGETWGDVKEMK